MRVVVMTVVTAMVNRRGESRSRKYQNQGEQKKLLHGYILSKQIVHV
jgi:hypothetical protein